MMHALFHHCGIVNTLRPRQNGCHFADDTFKHIFLNENIIIMIKISLKFVPMVRINNTPALVPILDWRRPGDKPLSGPMMVYLTDPYMRHSASMSQQSNQQIDNELCKLCNSFWATYVSWISWLMLPGLRIRCIPGFKILISVASYSRSHVKAWTEFCTQFHKLHFPMSFLERKYLYFD